MSSDKSDPLCQQLLAERRAEEDRLWAEQSAPYACALCGQPMDPAPGPDDATLLVCHDCFVELGGTADA